MAFPFREQRNQDVGAGHLLASGRLHVNSRALHHTLKAGGWFRVFNRERNDVIQFIAKKFGDLRTKIVDFDIARAHNCDSIIVVAQRHKQMLKGGEFVSALSRSG